MSEEQENRGTRKDRLFSTLRNESDKEREKIEKINELDLKKIYNHAIALNNKIIELNNTDFKNAGLSSNQYEIWVGESFVGMAILNDLTDIYIEGKEILNNVVELLDEIVYDILDEFQVPEETNAIKQKFRNIQFIFKLLINGKDLYFTEEEYEEIMELLDEYEEHYEYIFEYNLEDNLIDSLIIYLNMFSNDHSKEEIDKILETSIIPDLEKLGLSKLIPELRDGIKRMYDQEENVEYPEKQEKNETVKTTGRTQEQDNKTYQTKVLEKMNDFFEIQREE